MSAPPAEREETVGDNKPNRRTWRRRSWFAAVMLLLVFPYGLWLMWSKKPGWRGGIKWAVSVVLVAFWLPTILVAATAPAHRTSDEASPATSSQGTSPTSLGSVTRPVATAVA